MTNSPHLVSNSSPLEAIDHQAHPLHTLKKRKKDTTADRRRESEINKKQIEAGNCIIKHTHMQSQ